MWNLLMVLAPGVADAASLTLNPGDDVAAFTSSLAAGDVITFQPGIYELPSTITWTGTGTADAPIRLVAAQSGVILRGGTSGGGAVIRVREAAHLQLSGLKIEGTEPRFADENDDYNGLRIESSTDLLLEDLEIHQVGGTALTVSGNASRITMRGLHVHHSREGNGIYAGCNDASCWMEESLIEGCWIHDLPAQGGDGIEFGNGNQGNRLIDNVIHDLGGRGILLRSTERGAPNEVEGNAIWGAIEGGIRAGGAGRIRNNVIFDVEGPGLHVQNDRELLQDLVISFNTVVNTGAWAARLEGWTTATDMVFANNALTNPTGYALRALEADVDPSAARIVGNVVSGLVEGVLSADEGHFSAGAGAADYVDYAANDLYPSETSTLINLADPAGESWVPDTDFHGLPRDGAAPEVGAYEFVGAGNPGWQIEGGFKERTESVNGGHETSGCKKAREEGDESWALFPLLLGLGAAGRRRATAA